MEIEEEEGEEERKQHCLQRRTQRPVWEREVWFLDFGFLMSEDESLCSVSSSSLSNLFIGGERETTCDL